MILIYACNSNCANGNILTENSITSGTDNVVMVYDALDWHVD